MGKGKWGLTVPIGGGTTAPEAQPVATVSELRPTVSIATIEAEHAAVTGQVYAASLAAEIAGQALPGLMGGGIPGTPHPGFAPRPPTSAHGIIAQARERCAELRAEILRLDSLKGELAMLERMIAATEVTHAP